MAGRSEFTIQEDDTGRRIDRIIRLMFPGISLGVIYKALRAGDIRLDGKKVSRSDRVRLGQTLTLKGPIARYGADAPLPETPKASLTGFADRIAWENKHILIVNKLAGEVMHGPGTLGELVGAYLAGRIAPSLSFRPGPAHRLDKETSGLVIFSTSLLGAQETGRLLQEGIIQKRYIGLFHGSIPGPTTWNEPISYDQETRISSHDEAGKPAVTRIYPLGTTDEVTLACCVIETGRTHQIRAHAAIHGNPMVGDRKYGSYAGGSYVLHAGSLQLEQPNSILGFSHLWAPPPTKGMNRIVSALGDQTVTTVTEALSQRKLPW